MGPPYHAGGHGRFQEPPEEPLVVAADDHNIDVMLFRCGADAFDGGADFRDDLRRSRAARTADAGIGMGTVHHHS